MAVQQIHSDQAKQIEDKIYALKQKVDQGIVAAGS